jgi:hypothetical protein
MLYFPLENTSLQYIHLIDIFPEPANMKLKDIALTSELVKIAR